MKILVLGNGFDLDHGLPTSYTDFLNFCNCVVNMPGIDPERFIKLDKSQKGYIMALNTDEDMLKQFQGLLQKNQLFTYFTNRKDRCGKNWIDLEREISIVVSEFRTLEDEFKKTKSTFLKVDPEHRVLELLRDLGFHYTSLVLEESWFRAMNSSVCHWLETFSKALELYVADFINSARIEGVSPDIINFNADKILTFNYSNTYERVYGGLRWEEDIEYIHGQADKHIKEYSNIILGITSESGTDRSGYVEFEKYYQRITKRTGNNYKKWLQSKISVDTVIEIMFFGHSLDASDSDVIKELIENLRTEVKIVYHSQKAHQQIVANLIDILGKDKVITYVSGKKPKITFVPQKAHDNTSTAGIEISRDIRSLFDLYYFSEQSTQLLLEKIDTKIKTKDISYFYSQRKVISLFDALGYRIDNSIYKKELLEICGAIEAEKVNGSLKSFDAHEWSDYTPWGEEDPCSDEVREFIFDVNDTNRMRMKGEREKKKYAYFSRIDTPEEMKKALIKELQVDEPSKEYWSEMEGLVNLLAESKVLEKSFELIDSEQLSTSLRARFFHFKDIYEVHCRNLNMLRDDAERMFELYGEN